MRMELRGSVLTPAVVIIFETEEERAIISKVVGDKLQDADGFMGQVTGEVRLSSGYFEQYVLLWKPGRHPHKVLEPRIEDNPPSDVHGDSKDRS